MTSFEFTQEYSNSGMLCLNCNNLINTREHNTQCMTVMMYENKEQVIDNNFKNMMTFGLNGCYACFVVYKVNNDYKVWMFHHPDKKLFCLYLIRKLRQNKDNVIFVLIRNQGEYIKNEGDEYFHEEGKDNNELIELLELFNFSYLIEPYFQSSEYSQSIYVKYSNNKLSYLDNHGKVQDILI